MFFHSFSQSTSHLFADESAAVLALAPLLLLMMRNDLVRYTNRSLDRSDGEFVFIFV
jgi:hypothetical protein